MTTVATKNTGFRSLFSVLVVIAFLSNASAQGFGLAKKFGGTSDDYGNSIAVDGSGNIYTTGGFLETADFDPGGQVANLTAVGNSDAYIVKLDPDGNFLWAKSWGGPLWDKTLSIATDASGNVYTTGSFEGTADFDPGEGTANLTSEGGLDIFISKLDADGNFLWAKSMGATDWDEGFSITTDASGNVYSTGYFAGSVDFDPGAGTAVLTSPAVDDIYISKLDPNGNFLWAKRMGGESIAEGYSIAVDAAGNIYSCGVFDGTADFDPGEETFNLTSDGYLDVFVSKLDSDGNFLWAKQLGGSGNDNALSVAVDAIGNVYTTGNFEQTADFDPGTETFNLTVAGYADIFVSKLDPNGNFLFAKALGGSGRDTGYSIALDASGNIFITGSFTGTGDFDPGAGTIDLSSTGGWDIFVAKLDSDGGYLWAEHMGGMDNDEGVASALDATGNIYCTGFFAGFAHFDPVTDTANLISYGYEDAFVVKLTSESTGTDIVQTGFGTHLHLYPNPTTKNFQIDLGADYRYVRIRVTDLSGKTILTKTLKYTATVPVDMENLAAGAYVVHIDDANGNTAAIRLVKN